jgi:death-on-curing protein
MESLANNHGFVDGNKRTGFTAADTFLRLNGFYMNVETDQAYNLITTVMDPKKFEHGFKFGLILEWIYHDYEVIEPTV